MSQSDNAEHDAVSASRQFGLASLMLIMLWIATGLGLARAAAPLGIVYYVATLPALARTCRQVRASKRTGRSIHNRALLSTFLQSLRLVVMLATISGAALLGACLTTCLWCLEAAAEVSRWLGRALARIAHPFGRWTRWTFLLIGRLARALLQGPRRLVLSTPWRIVVLACSAVAAALLLGSWMVLSAVRACFAPLARLDRPIFLLRHCFAAWTLALVAADRRLLRAYQAAQ